MKLAMIGFGQAGGKIVDRFLEYDSSRGTGIIGHAVAVNSAKADLMGLNYVPNENRILIGQSVVKGHGAGTEPELGQKCAEEDLEEIQSAIDKMISSEIDAFLVIAGLGGGTGSGGSPILAEHLQRLYVEPVYGLGILPSRDEGGIYNRNAARSFQEFAETVDNLLVFDNDAFKTGGESLGEGTRRSTTRSSPGSGALFGRVKSKPSGDNVAESVVEPPRSSTRSANTGSRASATRANPSTPAARAKGSSTGSRAVTRRTGSPRRGTRRTGSRHSSGRRRSESSPSSVRSTAPSGRCFWCPDRRRRSTGRG